MAENKVFTCCTPRTVTIETRPTVFTRMKRFNDGGRHFMQRSFYRLVATRQTVISDYTP
jgi:hypothetical protein